MKTLLLLTILLLAFAPLNVAEASSATTQQISLGNADEISNVGGGMNVRTTVITVVRSVLSYLALIATVVIIIAGVLLVVGLGSEDSLSQAKNIILYAALGLIIILLAGAIVDLFIDVAAQANAS